MWFMLCGAFYVFFIILIRDICHFSGFSGMLSQGSSFVSVSGSNRSSSAKSVSACFMRSMHGGVLCVGLLWMSNAMVAE